MKEDSESDSSIDSDSRWKSGKQSKPEVFEDYIQDEEIEQLLDPEEDYRDTTAQGLSVIDPDGDSLLDEDESTSNMTQSDTRSNDQMQSSKTVEPTLQCQTFDNISSGQPSDFNKSEAPVKEDYMDTHIPENEIEQVIGGVNDNEGDNKGEQLHSSRFKSEQKMTYPGVKHIGKSRGSTRSGWVRPKNYQNRKHKRKLTGYEFLFLV
jgi:hypothetical protein